jgi:tRNA threonylcarbamoyladenosine biosynthesis protein TsaB
VDDIGGPLQLSSTPMLVLALDTTTPGGSVAIARAGRVIREEAGDPSLPPASQLPGRLMALLDHVAVDLSAVDAFAVATGPGSFTGLRVGIATMQGLAFAARKPLVGVSALDALARIASGDAHAGDRVAAWVDAWRGEVYAALYDHGRLVEPPVVARPLDLLSRLDGREVLFVGGGAQAYAGLIRDALGDAARIHEPPAPPLAGEIARLAAADAARGRGAPPGAIRPLYVRRSEAEAARDARRAP